MILKKKRQEIEENTEVVRGRRRRHKNWGKGRGSRVEKER